MQITDKEIQGIEDFYKKYVGKYFITPEGIENNCVFKLEGVTGRYWHVLYIHDEYYKEQPGTRTFEYKCFVIFFDTLEEAFEKVKSCRGMK